MAFRTIRGKSKFQASWSTEFNWVNPVEKDVYSARCNVCKNVFTVASMGRTAVVSHSKGKKHQENVKNIQNTTPLLSFFGGSSEASTSNLTVKDKQLELAETPSTSASGTTSLSSCDFHNTRPTKSVTTTANAYLVKESVYKAEILWCLQSVINHHSLRDAASSCEIFKIMFPDSEIANSMNLHKSKIAYTIVFGLGHHFKSILHKQIHSCSNLVVGFDESLNKIAQRQQMDISLRFWDSEKNEVVSRYFTSLFLNHTKAEDIKDSLISSLEPFDTKKILQVSMDGPNVNFKALKLLKEERSSCSNEEPQLLDFGSCGLHNIHGSFKNGIRATKWGTVEFLRALYNLFKDVPARRGDFSNMTSSYVFPLKFCAVRWLENIIVSERALSMLPNLKTYVRKCQELKKEPTCKSYFIVKEALEDKLLYAKLVFFKSIAEEFQPFLKEFQTSHPMAPFVYNQIIILMNNFMKRFIKEDVLKNQKSKDVDMKKKENLLSAKQVDLGYSTRLAIRKCREEQTITELEILNFRQQCRNSLQIIVTKLMERSPIKYKLTRALSCLDPVVAVSDSGTDLLKSLLEILVESNQISGFVASQVEREFIQFCSRNIVKVEMEKYRRTKRLDHFWIELLGESCEWKNLREFLKKMLILSHGTADLERGFSINRECVVANQQEDSLRAQRVIFDSVNYIGGISKVNIDTPMIHAAKNAHSRYKEAITQKKKEEDEGMKKESAKRKMKQQEKELREKKQKLLEEAERAASDIDSQLKALSQL